MTGLEWVPIALAVGCLLLFITSGVRVGLALLAAGTVGIILVDGVGAALSILGSRMFRSVATYSLTVIPMFILMGYFLNNTRLPSDIFASMRGISDRVPGAMGLASIGACAGFGAVTGSSITGVAAIGPMAIREMRRNGYSREFAGGLIAAAGTLGILIPPSISLVIFAILAGASIGQALIAGIVPGVFSALVYGAMTVYLASSGRGLERKSSVSTHQDIALADEPLYEKDTEVEGSTTGGIRSRSALALVQVAVLFILVVGGIYSGLVTVTESAALGAGGALVILVLDHASRREKSIVGGVSEALGQSVSVTSMVFLLIVGGAIFGHFLTISGITRSFTQWASATDLPPIMIVAAILVGLIVLGMFIDGLTILLITIPLTAPLVIGTFGFDPLWYGIVVVKTIEIGLITPPLGVNAYIVSGIAPDMPSHLVFRGAVPFLLADIATIAVLFSFPQIVLWLPAQMA